MNEILYLSIHTQLYCYIISQLIKQLAEWLGLEVAAHHLMYAFCGIIGSSGVASEVAVNNWWTRSDGDANNVVQIGRAHV